MSSGCVGCYVIVILRMWTGSLAEILVLGLIGEKTIGGNFPSFPLGSCWKHEEKYISGKHLLVMLYAQLPVQLEGPCENRQWKYCWSRGGGYSHLSSYAILHTLQQPVKSADCAYNTSTVIMGIPIICFFYFQHIPVSRSGTDRVTDAFSPKHGRRLPAWSDQHPVPPSAAHPPGPRRLHPQRLQQHGKPGPQSLTQFQFHQPRWPLSSTFQNSRYTEFCQAGLKFRFFMCQQKMHQKCEERLTMYGSKMANSLPKCIYGANVWCQNVSIYDSIALAFYETVEF